MLHYLSKIFSIFIFLFTSIFFSQELASKHLKFEEIEKKIKLSNNNNNTTWKLINIYLKEAKKENNVEALLYAYRYASNYSSFPENIKYSDSAIILCKNSKNAELITNAYINRSEILMNESLYQLALDDILIANTYSSKLSDDYTNYKTKYYIAQNKLYLGLYDEANKELESCVEYFGNNKNNIAFGKDF